MSAVWTTGGLAHGRTLTPFEWVGRSNVHSKGSAKSRWRRTGGRGASLNLLTWRNGAVGRRGAAGVEAVDRAVEEPGEGGFGCEGASGVARASASWGWRPSVTTAARWRASAVMRSGACEAAVRALSWATWPDTNAVMWAKISSFAALPGPVGRRGGADRPSRHLVVRPLGDVRPCRHADRQAAHCSPGSQPRRARPAAGKAAARRVYGGSGGAEVPVSFLLLVLAVTR